MIWPKSLEAPWKKEKSDKLIMAIAPHRLQTSLFVKLLRTAQNTVIPAVVSRATSASDATAGGAQCEGG